MKRPGKTSTKTKLRGIAACGKYYSITPLPEHRYRIECRADNVSHEFSWEEAQNFLHAICDPGQESPFVPEGLVIGVPALNFEEAFAKITKDQEALAGIRAPEEGDYGRK